MPNKDKNVKLNSLRNTQIDDLDKYINSFGPQEVDRSLGDRNEVRGVENTHNPYVNIDLDYEYGQYLHNPQLGRAGVAGLNELRARNQGGWEQFRNGSVKFVGKTATALAGGLAMLPAVIGVGFSKATGIGGGADGMDWDAVYDNAFQRSLDHINEQMDIDIPNYVTEAAKEYGIGRSMGTMNFWANDVLSGLSFTAGAVLTEGIMTASTAATLGAFAPAQLAATAAMGAKVAKLLKFADRTTRGAGKVGKFAAEAAKRTYGAGPGLMKLGRQLTTGAAYESGVEARQFKTQAMNKLELDFKKANGREATAEEKKLMDSKVSSYANGVFAANLALVGASNMVVLPSVFGFGLKKSQKLNKSARNVFRETITDPIKSAYSHGLKASSFYKIAKVSGAVVKKPFMEGIVEEGGQSVVSKSALELITQAHSPMANENTFNMVDAVGKGLEETYGTKEGWKEIVIGMIIGGIGSPMSIQKYKEEGLLASINIPLWSDGRAALDDYNQAKNEADKIARLNNQYNLATSTNSMWKNVTMGFSSSKEMDEHVANDDHNAIKNTESERLFTYVAARYAGGFYSDINDELIASVEEMSDEEYMETFEKEDVAKEDIAKERAETVKKIKRRVAEYKDSIEVAERLNTTGDSDITMSLGYTIASVYNVDERTEAMTNELSKEFTEFSPLTLKQHAELKAKLNRNKAALRKLGSSKGGLKRSENYAKELEKQLEIERDILSRNLMFQQETGVGSETEVKGADVHRANEKVKESTKRIQELQNKLREANEAQNTHRTAIEEINKEILKTNEGLSLEYKDDFTKFSKDISDLLDTDAKLSEELGRVSKLNVDEITRKLRDLEKLALRKEQMIDEYNALKTEEGQKAFLNDVDSILAKALKYASFQDSSMTAAEMNAIMAMQEKEDATMYDYVLAKHKLRGQSVFGFENSEKSETIAGDTVAKDVEEEFFDGKKLKVKSNNEEFNKLITALRDPINKIPTYDKDATVAEKIKYQKSIINMIEAAINALKGNKSTDKFMIDNIPAAIEEFEKIKKKHEDILETYTEKKEARKNAPSTPLIFSPEQLVKLFMYEESNTGLQFLDDMNQTERRIYLQNNTSIEVREYEEGGKVLPAKDNANVQVKLGLDGKKGVYAVVTDEEGNKVTIGGLMNPKRFLLDNGSRVLNPYNPQDLRILNPSFVNKDGMPTEQGKKAQGYYSGLVEAWEKIESEEGLTAKEVDELFSIRLHNNSPMPFPKGYPFEDKPTVGDFLGKSNEISYSYTDPKTSEVVEKKGIVIVSVMKGNLITFKVKNEKGEYVAANEGEIKALTKIYNSISEKIRKKITGQARALISNNGTPQIISLSFPDHTDNMSDVESNVVLSSLVKNIELKQREVALFKKFKAGKEKLTDEEMALIKNAIDKDRVHGVTVAGTVNSDIENTLITVLGKDENGKERRINANVELKVTVSDKAGVQIGISVNEFSTRKNIYGNLYYEIKDGKLYGSSSINGKKVEIESVNKLFRLLGKNFNGKNTGVGSTSENKTYKVPSLANLKFVNLKIRSENDDYNNFKLNAIPTSSISLVPKSSGNVNTTSSSNTKQQSSTPTNRSVVEGGATGVIDILNRASNKNNTEKEGSENKEYPKGVLGDMQRNADDIKRKKEEENKKKDKSPMEVELVEEDPNLATKEVWVRFRDTGEIDQKYIKEIVRKIKENLYLNQYERFINDKINNSGFDQTKTKEQQLAELDAQEKAEIKAFEEKNSNSVKGVLEKTLYNSNLANIKNRYNEIRENINNNSENIEEVEEEVSNVEVGVNNEELEVESFLDVNEEFGIEEGDTVSEDGNIDKKIKELEAEKIEAKSQRDYEINEWDKYTKEELDSSNINRDQKKKEVDVRYVEALKVINDKIKAIKDEKNKPKVNENKTNEDKNIDEELNEAGFSITSQEGLATAPLDFKKAYKELLRMLPPGIKLENVQKILDNLALKGDRNNGYTLGAFMNDVIYLNSNAPFSKLYHEAFHAVFRTLLSNKDIKRFYGRARRKYHKPSKKKIKELRDLSSLHENKTDKELELLWYEEKMAEEFEKYAKGENVKKVESWWKKLFDSIIDFFNFFKKSKDEIDLLFHDIYTGNFSNSKTQYNIFSKSKGENIAFSLLGFTDVITNKTTGKASKINKYLSSEESEAVINTIALEVYRNSNGMFNTTSIKDEIENFKNRFSISNITPLLNTFRAAKDVTRYNKLVKKSGIIAQALSANIKNNKSNIELIVKEVNKRLSLYNNKPIEDEYLEEQDEQEDTTENWMKSPNEIGGFGNVSKEMKQYIAFTSDLIDIFKLGLTDKQLIANGSKFRLSSNPSKIFNGIENNLVGVPVRKMLKTFRLYADENENAKAFQAKLFLDIKLSLGLDPKLVSDEELTEMPYEKLAESSWYTKFITTFNKNREEFSTSLVDPNSGNVNTFSSNRRNVDQVQFDEWLNEYRAKRVTKDQVDKELKEIKSKMLSIFYKQGGKVSIAHISDVINDVKKRFNNIGISLSRGYIKYSLINNFVNYVNEDGTIENLLELDLDSQSLTPVERAYLQDMQDYHTAYEFRNIPSLDKSTLEGLLSANADVTESNDAGIFARETNTDGSANDKTGAIGRLKGIAKGNSIFDESVAPSTFTNSENKTMHDKTAPSFLSTEITRLNNRARREFVKEYLKGNIKEAMESLKIAMIEDGSYEGEYNFEAYFNAIKDNPLIKGWSVNKDNSIEENEEFANLIFDQMLPQIAEGIRQESISTKTDKEGNEVDIVEYHKTGSKGKSYSKLDQRGKILYALSLFADSGSGSNNKSLSYTGKAKNNEDKIKAFRKFVTGVYETKAKTTILDLPVQKFVQNGKLTELGFQYMTDLLKHESERIGRIAKELQDIVDGNKKTEILAETHYTMSELKDGSEVKMFKLKDQHYKIVEKFEFNNEDYEYVKTLETVKVNKKDVKKYKPLRGLQYFQFKDLENVDKHTKIAVESRLDLKETRQREVIVTREEFDNFIDFQFKEYVKLLQSDSVKIIDKTGSTGDSFYKGKITPTENTIFVFGSNPQGKHGAGAALDAKKNFGAIQTQSEGLQGKAFGIITKDLKKAKALKLYSAKDITDFMKNEVIPYYKNNPFTDVVGNANPFERSVSPEDIIASIKKMYEEARQNPDKDFKVAGRGNEFSWGLNGYINGELMAMYNEAGPIPSNVLFNESWVKTGNLKITPKDQKGVKDVYTSSILPKEYLNGNEVSLNRMRDFFYNDYINTTAINNLIDGDLSKTHKNAVDVVKRNAGKNANGPSMGEGTSRIAFIKSVEESLLEEDSLDGTGKEMERTGVKGENTKIDRTDAQTFGSIDWYINKYAKSTGKRTELIKPILKKVKRGFPLTNKENNILNQNNINLNSRKIVIRGRDYYDKTSLATLTRQLTSIRNYDLFRGMSIAQQDIYINNKYDNLDNASTELERKQALRDIHEMWLPMKGREKLFQLLKQMEIQNIDIMSYDSAAKSTKQDVGIYNNTTGLWEMTPFEVNDNTIREQVNTDGMKEETTDPTQKLALIWSEQDITIDGYFQGKPINLKVLIEAYDKHLSDRVKEGFRKKRMSIFKDLGIGSKNSEVKYKELHKVFIASLESSNADPFLIELFTLKDGAIADPKYNWNYPAIETKFQNMYLSYMSNKSLKQKIAGTKYTLVSDFGFDVIRLDGKIITSEQYALNPEKYSKATTSRLRHRVKDEVDGNYYSEVIVSRAALDLYGLEIGDSIPDHVAKQLGLRIPTQDKHSMVTMKVVDLLPEMYGNTIVLPMEIVLLSGADFDVDSLYSKKYETYKGKKYGAYIDSSTPVETAFEEYISDFENSSDFKSSFKEFQTLEFNLKKDKLKENKNTRGDIKRTLRMYVSLMKEGALVDSDKKNYDEIKNQLKDIELLISNSEKEIKDFEDKAKVSVYNKYKKLQTLESFKKEYEFKIKNNIKKLKKGDIVGLLPITNRERNNILLDIELSLVHNEGNKEIAGTPATMTALKELEDFFYGSDKSKGQLGLENPDNSIGVNSPLDKARASNSNDTGLAGVGPSANFNTMFQRLHEAGIELNEGDFKPLLGKTGFIDLESDDGARINDTISTLLSAMTDNAKERYAKKFNLSKETLGPTLVMVGMGIPLKTSLLLLKQPAIIEMANIMILKKSSILNRKEERAFRSIKEKDIAGSLIKKYSTGLKEDPKTFEVDLEGFEITDDVMIASLDGTLSEDLQSKLQVSVLREFNKALTYSTFLRNFSQILTLTKGTKVTWAEVEGINNALEELGISVNVKGYEEGSRVDDASDVYIQKTDKKVPFDVYDSIMKSKLLTTNIKVVATLQHDSKNFFILNAETSNEMMDAIKAIFKQDIFKYSDNNKQLRTALIGHLTVTAYAHKTNRNKDINKPKYEIEELFNDSLHVQHSELLAKYPNNALLRFLKPDITDYTGDKHKNHQFYGRKLYKLVGNTRTTKNPDLVQSLMNSYKELFISGDPLAKEFSLKMFNYVLMKDNMLFRKDTVVRQIEPYFLGNVMRSLTDVQTLFSGKKGKSYNDVFGMSKKQLISEFVDKYSRHSENTFNLRRTDIGRILRQSKGVAKDNALPEELKKLGYNVSNVEGLDKNDYPIYKNNNTGVLSFNVFGGTNWKGDVKSVEENKQIVVNNVKLFNSTGLTRFVEKNGNTRLTFPKYFVDSYQLESGANKRDIYKLDSFKIKSGTKYIDVNTDGFVIKNGKVTTANIGTKKMNTISDGGMFESSIVNYKKVTPFGSKEVLPYAFSNKQWEAFTQETEQVKEAIRKETAKNKKTTTTTTTTTGSKGLGVGDILRTAGKTNTTKSSKTETSSNTSTSTGLGVQAKFDAFKNKNKKQLSSNFDKVSVERATRILDKLAAKFGIKYEFDSTLGSLGVFRNGKVIINPNLMSLDTPFHEFAHPFIAMIKVKNPKLYRELVREIRREKNILAFVKETYKGELKTESEFLEEAIVTALGRYAANKLNPTLLDKVKEFFSAIFSSLKGIFVGDIDPNTSLRELAYMLVDNSKIDIYSENVINLDEFVNSFDNRTLQMYEELKQQNIIKTKCK